MDTKTMDFYWSVLYWHGWEYLASQLTSSYLTLSPTDTTTKYYIGQSVHFETLKISLGCIWLLISFCYVLCIYGAMLEARETNTPGIVDGPSGVEKGQPGTEIITVPSIPAQGQQVYLTPGSLGVEMGQHIDMQPKYDVEASAPPSYYELFPTMEQSSK